MDKIESYPNPCNICYFNSVLQCILHSSGNAEKRSDKEPTNFIMIKKMNELLENKKSHFRINGLQNCAAETVTYFFEAFEDKKEFCDKFIIKTVTKLVCLSCGKFSFKNELSPTFFLSASKDIREELIFSHELCEYKCETCSQNKCIKITSVINSPEVFIFILQKQENRAPVRINLKHHGKDYELCGMVHHFGNESGGHYVASIKIEKEWFTADDTVIRKGNAPVKLSTILFYKVIKTE